ncbi:CHAT domain-containing protein [Trebonia kvetii]|uniref:CHAT domain-containing protein n=1 Tax=Trebonia kvetii TaxID=2480626 RepID=A0A6P2BXF2_9ACTN|nr:tetratricopeptide repeat protein [Trebonia kvetii]TVZ02855.1 CHAT domain-containing protein [Trebonia kvetii]
MGGQNRSAADVSRLLHASWTGGPAGELAKSLADRIPVPGALGLRGRFHFLTDPAVPAMPGDQFLVSWDTWQRQVELTNAADAALIANDTAAAGSALTALRATQEDGLHPLPVVDALVGLGDAARQADRFEEAAAHYEGAMELAQAASYRFGLVRALVPVGYLTLLSGSAGQAADTFGRAADLARDLDERVYLAAALTGRGEALVRLREDDAAERALAEALRLSESLGADVGIVNAAQQLGDLYRSRGRLDEAKAALTRALDAAGRSGTLIGTVNACDALGEVCLRLADLDGARSYYLRAYEMSAEGGYRRGEAWALYGLGRCAYALDLPQEAYQLFEGALEANRELGDLPSSATALDGMARAAGAMADTAAETRARVDAVLAIEAMRSSQDLHQYQQEYLRRFAMVYSAAIRAAVRNADPGAFITVFENLAGRRLAGLLEKIPPAAAAADAQLASQVLATASSLPADGADLAANMASAQWRARLVGRLALRGGMPERAERAIADIAAALYRSFSPDDAVPLLDRAAANADVLLVTLVPGAGDQLAWLSAGPGRPARSGLREISAAVQRLVSSLARDGLHPLARPGEVSALADLLPAQAFEGLADDARLLIVPLGDLWALPWPAVPVGEAFLGERFTLAVAPSLTLADHVRGSREMSRPRTVGQWRSTQIKHHDLVAFADDKRVALDAFSSADVALTAVTSGRRHDLIVIAGHGRPVPGMVHYLELAPRVLLTPAALLDARTPDQLVLAACWGANAPGSADSDPLTLATIALTRGSLAVLATTSELADDPIASRFLNGVLHRLPASTMPEALRAMTRRFLADPRHRNGYLSRWAPLITVGAV